MQILSQSFRRFVNRGTAQESSRLFFGGPPTPSVTQPGRNCTPRLARGTRSTSSSITSFQCFGEPTGPSRIPTPQSQSLLERSQIRANQSSSVLEPSQITAHPSQSLLGPSSTIYDSIPDAAYLSPGGQIFSDQADRIPRLSTANGLQNPPNASTAPLSTISDVQTSSESSAVTTSAIESESDDNDSPSEELCTRGQGIDSALKVIAGRVDSSRRAQTLIRVLRGSVEALQQPPEFYKMLWSGNDNVFAGGESDSRLRRHYRGRKKIDKFHQQFECAGRLSLVFLAHDIEVTKSRDWKLGPGQSRQYVAVLWIAHHLGVSPEDIKDEWRRSQNYTRLLEDCGPGVLLELGTGVNWW